MHCLTSVMSSAALFWVDGQAQASVPVFALRLKADEPRGSPAVDELEGSGTQVTEKKGDAQSQEHSKIAFFDLDNTLVPTRAVKKALGLKTDPRKDNDMFTRMLLNSSERKLKLSTRQKQKREAVLEEYTPVFERAGEVIQAAQGKGYKVVIVTNSGMDAVQDWKTFSPHAEKWLSSVDVVSATDQLTPEVKSAWKLPLSTVGFAQYSEVKNRHSEFTEGGLHFDVGKVAAFHSKLTELWGNGIPAEHRLRGFGDMAADGDALLAAASFVFGSDFGKLDKSQTEVHKTASEEDLEDSATFLANLDAMKAVFESE